MQSSELRLTSVEQGDQGFYRCKAVFGNVNSDFTGGTVYTDPAALMVIDFSTSPAYTANPGQNLVLTTTITYTEELTVTWYKTGSNTPLISGSDYVIAQTYPNGAGDFKYTEATLTILGLDLSSSDSFYSKTTVTLSGTVKQVQSDPVLIHMSHAELTDGFSAAGETVTLYCAFSGTATASSTSLYKQGNDGTWSNVNISPSTLTGATLTTVKSNINEPDATFIDRYEISGTGNSDIGKYKCRVVENSHSLVTESAPNTLQLLTQSVTKTKMLLEVGDTALITCTFSGPYVPTVTGEVLGSIGSWAEDGNAYLSSFTSVSSQEGGTEKITSTVVFSKVARSNTPFRCHASFSSSSRPLMSTSVPSDRTELLAVSMELGTHEDRLKIYVGAQFTFICQYKYETTGSVVSISPTPTSTDTYSVKDDTTGVTSGYVNGFFGTYSTPKTEGPFSCTIQIDGLSLTKEISVDVISVPSSPTLESLSIQEGDYNWLTCTVTSDIPIYTLSWFTTDDTGAERYVRTDRFVRIVRLS